MPKEDIQCFDRGMSIVDTFFILKSLTNIDLMPSFSIFQ